MSAHVVVIGSGFAALTAVRELRRRDQSVRITLVAPKAELMYYPSLIWVPAGLRRGDDLRIDVAAFLAEQRVDFHAPLRASTIKMTRSEFEAPVTIFRVYSTCPGVSAIM